jgi:hypothetical protein
MKAAEAAFSFFPGIRLAVPDVKTKISHQIRPVPAL